MMPEFIAEIGNNHNGNLALAKRMTDAAIAAGADWVKFQAYRTETFLAPGNAFHDELAVEALPLEEFAVLKDYVESRGARFLVTPFDRDSFDLLDRLGMDTVKISSGDFDNFDLLGLAVARKKKIILSLGGGTLSEIDATVSFLRARGAEFILLHCVLAYPAAFPDLNLRFIETLRTRYGVPVGYSDHSLGIEGSLAAIALGAAVIERHFTIDRALPGGDNAMSILPEELARLRREGLNIAAALGGGERTLGETEKAVRKLVKRTYHAARDIGAGVVLADDDILLLRPAMSDQGFSSSQRSDLIGKTLRKAVPRGALIDSDVLEH